MQILLFIDHAMGWRPGEHAFPGTPYTALIAHCISDAMDFAQRQKPDVIILNPQTVVAEQFLEILESFPEWKTVPVILYAYETAADELFAFRQVERTVVFKKEGLDRLLCAVDGVLSGRPAE